MWLNGKKILAADNMFRSHRIDVDGRICAHENRELVIRFPSRSTDACLKQKPGPRPRWKTNLSSVDHQQLRWQQVRTTLAGPHPGLVRLPVPPVGPLARHLAIDTDPDIAHVGMSDVRQR